MPKTAQYLIVKILVVTVFVSVLAAFGLAWDEPEHIAAVETEEYDSLTCDESIPIGVALDEVLGILDEAFNVYNGENMSMVMDNITGVVKALISERNVCDFTNCVAQVDDQSPELVVQFDAFFWKGELTFNVPPWCVPQQGIGEPCPDLSPFLEENDSNIMGLMTLRDSFLNSAEQLHDIFETATEPLPVDLAKYQKDEDGNIVLEGGKPKYDIEPGTKITKADLALKMAEQVELQLTPSTYKSCALSALERKLVDDGRIGNVFPMQCKQAREEGLYWPRKWSLECAKECDSDSEKDCIKCLGNDPGDKASRLASINYKIYGTCKDQCGPEDPDTGKRKWTMNQECQNCLCTIFTTTVDAENKKLSDEECLAWLCGGSVSNWVCCHETTPEGLGERPEIDPFNN